MMSYSTKEENEDSFGLASTNPYDGDSVYFSGDVSSVDILNVNDVFCVDIRDTFTKEWRRHSESSTSGSNKDYRQVARYRMRSIEDAAELFALLYKFITER